MGKNTGKVREFCQSGKVGTLLPCNPPVPVSCRVNRQCLLFQGETLLCQLQEEPQQKPPPPGSRFRYQVPQLKPKGYFLILPSNSDSLLIKSVADADLILPAGVNSSEAPTPESEAVIESCLNKVTLNSQITLKLLHISLSELPKLRISVVKFCNRTHQTSLT